MSASAFPDAVLDGDVHLAQLVRWDAERDDLAESHYGLPGDHLHPGRWAATVEPVSGEQGVDLRDRLRLFVTEEDGEQGCAVRPAAGRRCDEGDGFRGLRSRRLVSGRARDPAGMGCQLRNWSTRTASWQRWRSSPSHCRSRTRATGREQGGSAPERL